MLGLLECRPATGPAELAAHYSVRHRVFVEEQRIFAGTDRDDHDDDRLTIHVVGSVGPAIGGTVRLFPLDPGGRVWQGDRLAVLREYRAHGLGAPLVGYAVRTAGERGGRLMVAHIQLPNVPFFERLGWHATAETEIYAGRPHRPMAIRLTAG